MTIAMLLANTPRRRRPGIEIAPRLSPRPGMAYDDGYGRPQVQLQFPPFQGWIKLVLINGGIFLGSSSSASSDRRRRGRWSSSSLSILLPGGEASSSGSR